MILSFCLLFVYVVSSWRPIDIPVQRWNRPLLYEPIKLRENHQYTTIQAYNQWKLLPVYWPKNSVVQLIYCLVPNKKHPVLLELVYTAFDMWNQCIPKVVVSGINLTFVGYCNQSHSYGMIILRPIRRNDTVGTVIRNRNQTITIELDIRLMQSAGLFYNVLLHEIGHLLGCDHPNRESDEGRMSTMLYTTLLSRDLDIIQDNEYNTLQVGDITCLHQLYIRDFSQYIMMNVQNIVPRYPAWKHISGQWDAEVPLSIPTTAADTSVIWTGFFEDLG